ncbi:hypothetical protein Tco_0602336 [Tanacetum coccineum]
MPVNLQFFALRCSEKVSYPYRRLIELENQVQRLMEAHLAPTQPTQVNKITTLCEICSGPHDTQYCMKDPEQSLVEYASSRTDEGVWLSEDDGEVMFIKIIQDDDKPQNEGPNKGGGATTEGPVIEYFDTFPTRDELTNHKYLMCGPILSIFLRNPIITKGHPSNLKIPCNNRHVHVEKSYINLNSPLNIMTRMMYNWIMRRKLNPMEDVNRGVSNFTGRIKGMHVFIGNFTYIMDFMIIEDISSIIDPRLSQVVLGKPFVEISNMTHDPQEGVVRYGYSSVDSLSMMDNEVGVPSPKSTIQTLSSFKEYTPPVTYMKEIEKTLGILIEIYSMAGEDEFRDDNPLPPPPVPPTKQAPHTLSTIKLSILKKGEYDIWAMKMEHYLGHTDYPIWEVIQK